MTVPLLFATVGTAVVSNGMYSEALRSYRFDELSRGRRFERAAAGFFWAAFALLGVSVVTMASEAR